MQTLPSSASGGAVSRPQSQNDTGSVQKEQGVFSAAAEPPLIQEVSQEMEVSAELQHLGVQKKSETIELPPDVQQMGVQAVGATQPVMVVTATPALPLTDQQIAAGLHARLVSSFRWLAEWCAWKLKKLHIHLKTIHGALVRVRE